MAVETDTEAAAEADPPSAADKPSKSLPASQSVSQRVRERVGEDGELRRQVSMRGWGAAATATEGAAGG